MFWHEAETNENFPIRRFVSTPSARWEIGLRPVLFGVRVSMSLNGSEGIELDYCCGQDQDEWFLYLGMICGLCIYLPEDIEPSQLRRLFPHQTIRPLSKDKRCQSALFSLSELLYRQSHEPN